MYRSPRKVCRCSKCRRFSVIDPRSGQPTRGVLQTLSLWQKHQDEEGARVKQQIIETVFERGETGDDNLLLNGDSDRDDDVDMEVEEVDDHVQETADKSHSDTSLKELEVEFASTSSAFRKLSDRIRVVFLEDGGEEGDKPPPLSWTDNPEINQHLRLLESLKEQALGIQGDEDTARQRGLLLEKIEQEVKRVDRLVERGWRLHKDMFHREPGRPRVILPPNRIPLLSASEPILVCLVTIVVLHLLSGLPQDSCNYALVMMRTLVSSACILYIKRCGVQHPPDPLPILGGPSAWPVDIRTAMDKLSLDPATVKYAFCTTCSAIYPPDADGRYPTTCTFQEFPRSPTCDTPLTKRDEGREPTVPFLYQPMEQWLGRLLSRPEMVKEIEAQSGKWGHQVEAWKDIFNGRFLRGFMGRDRRPFLQVPAGELRLVFSLNVDWFNPFGRKSAGKAATVGGIYMICMNLPVHLRYRLENVYLAGIIPGPKEPKLDEINHFLKPLVDTLLQLWHPGIEIANVGVESVRYVVKCALAVLICDLPASRKVGGFAGHAADMFCSFCKLRLGDITNFDKDTWVLRTELEHRANAERFRRAANSKTKEWEFQQHYTRWSELLRLPYWNPIVCGALDSMHNLFLGLIKTHCRALLGMDDSVTGDRRMKPHDTAQQQAQLDLMVKALQDSKKIDRTALSTLRKGYLDAFAALNSIENYEPKPTKDDVIDAIIAWRKSHPDTAMIRPKPYSNPVYNFPLPGAKRVLLDAETITELRDDIMNTTMPSWLPPPPLAVGSKGNGKLSADEWRTVFTVSLVFTLTRLWGKPDATPHQKRLLDNFMALVIAVRLATKRITSEKIADEVEARLFQYVKTVVELFGEDVIVANHHLALHLPDCIRQFGPVHGWWAFPFERFNGIIQRFNTNFKIGELESTFTKTFCRGANLRSMIADFSGTELLQQMKRLLDQYFPTQWKGTLKNDLLALGESGAVESMATFTGGKQSETLPEAHRKLVQEWLNANHPGTTVSVVQYTKDFMKAGVTFACAEKSRDNAQIMFWSRVDGGDDGGKRLVAGQIEKIFVHQHMAQSEGQSKPVVQRFMLVKPYKELSDELQATDPYRQFPEIEAWICKDELGETTLVVPDDLQAHAATCRRDILGVNARIVMSLNRD